MDRQQENRAGDCDCERALRGFVRAQRERISALELVLKAALGSHARRERQLIGRIARLHDDMRNQADIFQRQLDQIKTDPAVKCEASENSRRSHAQRLPPSGNTEKLKETRLDNVDAKHSIGQKTSGEYEWQLDDIKFVEVTLSRGSRDDRIGLTLCSSGTAEEDEDVDSADGDRDVFVDEVTPDSVAALDGRIYAGDQLLRVDGDDVTCRDHAVTLFRRSGPDVALLLARPCQPLADDRLESLLDVLEVDEDEDLEEDLEEEEEDEAGAGEDSGVGGPAESSGPESEILGRELEALKLSSDNSRVHDERVEMWVRSLDGSSGGESSAYHSAGSCGVPNTVDKGTQLDSDALSVFSCASCKRCPVYPEQPVKRRTVTAAVKTPPPPPMSPPIAYTDEANLERTMRQQQEMLKRSVERRQSEQSFDTCNKQEWKVKKRADGTRYITRRPVRSQLLKDRAMKLHAERCGVTTDEDAMSELKLGRYWSKEDRKKHLDKVRNRRQEQQQLQMQRRQGANVAATSANGNIVELSRRKMLRRTGQTLFDDFTTVQEVLAHGAGKGRGLLSVTTV